jgi:acyl-CoA hydrolase
MADSKPMKQPRYFEEVEACVDAIIERVGHDIRLGVPLGLGKPAELINALYARARRDANLKLTLLTALSLRRPYPSGLEGALLNPFLERVYEGVVELDYVRDQDAGQLPPNVRVLEFFFQTGARLKDEQAQRDYISTNYTFAARDVYAQGCNVIAQIVAKKQTAQGERYSLSCNPDTGPELERLLRAAEARGERRIAVVAQVNQQLPYMGNDAEVEPANFDLVIDQPRYSSALFSVPKTPVSVADHAIGLRVSTLVRDGGRSASARSVMRSRMHWPCASAAMTTISAL